jgi:NosR/NirI family transcriptional regulator, nitrous oxide reductase regulator
LSRITSLAAGLILLLITAAQGEVLDDPELLGQLRQLFPLAASFSPRSGNPPHFRAFGAPEAGGEPALLGLAYWTTELEPLERAYDGPIKMLVGMDMEGVLKGIVMAEHREPYGYFSIDLPEFALQFERKNIRDRFRAGDDIDGVSRATITVQGAARAVRNSSRRIARAYLVPPEQ